jgi:hypothetical protein
MKYLQIWAAVFWVAGVATSTIMNGFAGFLAAGLAIPAFVCLGIASTKAGIFSGLGTALACIVGMFVVSGLIEILFKGVGTQVLGLWAGYWKWFWGGGIWLTIGLAVGSFLVTLVVGAATGE